MHVLISAVWGAHSPSGICRHAANLSTSLARLPEIDRVTLLVGSWQYDYFQESFALDLPKLRLESVNVSSGIFARNLWYLFEFPKLVSRQSPDIVHLSFPVPFLKYRMSAPVVCTIHDLYAYDLPEHFGRFRAYFNRWFLRICIGGSEHLTCVSDTTKLRLTQLFPAVAANKVSRIYNIVSSAFASTEAPFSSSLTSRPFLLVVAQHRRNKCLDLLLRAFSELLASGELAASTMLIIVGSYGPETDGLYKLIAKLDLDTNIEMRCGLSEPELNWLYRRCLLLVAPSACEGFNLPLAEAASVGTRLVCSDIPVHREIAGSICEYFDSSSPSAVNELSNAIRRSLLHQTPEPVRTDRFSADIVASQYAALYRKLLQSTAAGSDDFEGCHDSQAS